MTFKTPSGKEIVERKKKKKLEERKTIKNISRD